MHASVTVKAWRLSLAIALLALVGVADSALALHHHYAKSKSAYCDFGENFNCDIVNRSSYSVVAGVPVALIGIIGYATMLALSTFYRSKAETPAMLTIASAGGLAFALYLTYIEGFVLSAWCILCLTSLTAMVAITALSAAWLVHSIRNP